MVVLALVIMEDLQYLLMDGTLLMHRYTTIQDNTAYYALDLLKTV